MTPTTPEAALAAALHSLHHHLTEVNGQPSPDFDGEWAAAILAALPGWTLVGDEIARLSGDRDALIDRAEAADEEVARLRDALEDANRYIRVAIPPSQPPTLWPTPSNANTWSKNAEIARLRAALTEIRDNARSTYDDVCQWCQRGWQDGGRPHEPDCPADIAASVLETR